MTSPTATTFLLLLQHFLIAFTSSQAKPPTPIQNRDLFIAMEEMERANYFSFPMLINMSPPHLFFHANLTFLVPRDRALSRTVMPETAVSDFVLRHSVPSPLPFDCLRRLPAGSVLPSSEPGFTLTLQDDGARRGGLFLNNVRVAAPDICMAGNSFRCHGIDGVLSVPPATLPPPSSNNSAPPPVRPGGVLVAPPSPPPSTWLSPPAPPPPPPLVGRDATPPPPSPLGLETRDRSGSSQGLALPCKGALLWVAVMASALGGLST